MELKLLGRGGIVEREQADREGDALEECRRSDRDRVGGLSVERTLEVAVKRFQPAATRLLSLLRSTGGR